MKRPVELSQSLVRHLFASWKFRCRHRWDYAGDLLYDGCWCSDEKCLDCGERRWWPS